MRLPGIEVLERVIGLVEESRFTHERAIYEPDKDEMGYTGSPAFHRKCIDEYDEILVVLRQVRRVVVSDNKARRTRKAESG